MRAPFVIASAALFLGLAACASTDTVSRYQKDLDRLNESCTAREGILSPSGRNTGRPEVDNVCRINGPATRIGAN